jgi:hypothetical protein
MRVQLSLDYGIEELLRRFASAAGCSVDTLASRILNGRFQEIEELLDFARAHLEDPAKRGAVRALLSRYDGGEYVYETMKEIDPDYRTPLEAMAEMHDDLLDGLVDALNRTAP